MSKELKPFLKSLADAFRSVLGTTDKINAQSFPDKVNEVYEKGKSEGGNTEEAYNEGLAAGKQAEYDKFWDEYQANGTRTSYLLAFAGSCWNAETFKPKYPLIVSNANQMFQYASGLKNIEYEIEIIANSDAARYMFSYSKIERIKLLKVNEALQYTGSFGSCNNLMDITIGGSIGNNISFSSSNLLTDESVDSIVNALKDLTSATSKTLTVHADVYNKMVERGVDALVTAKNWILAKA